jgi:hypothetical protein
MDDEVTWCAATSGSNEGSIIRGQLRIQIAASSLEPNIRETISSTQQSKDNIYRLVFNDDLAIRQDRSGRSRPTAPQQVSVKPQGACEHIRWKDRWARRIRLFSGRVNGRPRGSSASTRRKCLLYAHLSSSYTRTSSIPATSLTFACLLTHRYPAHHRGSWRSLR